MQHCFPLSRKSLRFLGSATGIAIANRKNRCNFGAVSSETFALVFYYRHIELNPCNQVTIGWPGQSAEMCRRFSLYKFWRTLPGIFLAEFLGAHFGQEPLTAPFLNGLFSSRGFPLKLMGCFRPHAENGPSKKVH